MATNVASKMLPESARERKREICRVVLNIFKKAYISARGVFFLFLSEMYEPVTHVRTG